MCGILFSVNGNFSLDEFEGALNLQKWRGPDNTGIEAVGDKMFMGHVRLAILDMNNEANQPMLSACKQYKLIYNGEIYNHMDLRLKYGLRCKTSSDTETLLEGLIRFGVSFIDQLNGMFSFVMVHIPTGKWWAARDRFGIKPLYSFHGNNTTIISSEPISIRRLVNTSVRSEAWSEWELFRRTMPGSTFFNEITEILPGSVIESNSKIFNLEIPSNQDNIPVSDDAIYDAIIDSVKIHELSDVKNVALLSGGLDSSIIVALSNLSDVYSVGLKSNNEFKEASETAIQLNKDIKCVTVNNDQLRQAWAELILLKGEPINVPNEGLIYLVCKAMDSSEKVVLTGEGADEIFFGYDKIYRWALSEKIFKIDDFLKMYCYNENTVLTDSIKNYIFGILENKTPIEFIEKFFVEFHLPGLLRRMDFASMAASKEARVPFVNNNLFKLLYKSRYENKINSHSSKIQLRNIAKRIGLFGPLNRKKIGFSSSQSGVQTRHEEYKSFQDFNKEILGW